MIADINGRRSASFRHYSRAGGGFDRPVALPLLKLRKPGLAEAMELPLNTDVDAESVAALLRVKMCHQSHGSLA